MVYNKLRTQNVVLTLSYWKLKQILEQLAFQPCLPYLILLEIETCSILPWLHQSFLSYLILLKIETDSDATEDSDANNLPYPIGN